MMTQMDVFELASRLLREHELDRTDFCRDACDSLRAQLDHLDLHRPLLVQDTRATEANGINGKLVQTLFGSGEATVVEVFATLPHTRVDELGEICRAGGFDCIIAVGGGATLDAAKLIALQSSNESPLLSLLESGYSPNRLPIFAVPTTAGSGSEATQFAVLFVGEQKHSLAHPSLRPQVAIVDPALISTVPTTVAAAAGLDVLCQSIESLWARGANADSIQLATEALRLVAPNLKSAVVERDPDSQAALCLASHLAGQAINHSRTTICHALSYFPTIRYRIPHGIAAASTLPAACLFNFGDTGQENIGASGNETHPCVQELLKVLGCTDVDSLVRELVLLIRSVSGAASVAELSLPSDYEPEQHAKAVNLERLGNNPRRGTSEDMVDILSMEFDKDGRRER